MDPTMPVADPDTYDWPDRRVPGTGLRRTVDYGAHVTFTEGKLTAPIATISPWQYLPVEIPGSRWGAAALRQNTKLCAGATAKVTIRDVIPLAAGDIHTNAGEIAAGIQELIDKDPAAAWNPVTRRVTGSCADLLLGPCGSISPRIIAVAVYDTGDLADQSVGGVPLSVIVSNVIGFFVETVVDDPVTGFTISGYITTHPGIPDFDADALYDDSSFLRASTLVE
jgi:uncharacterized protein (DUF2237 family)